MQSLAAHAPLHPETPSAAHIGTLKGDADPAPDDLGATTHADRVRRIAERSQLPLFPLPFVVPVQEPLRLVERHLVMKRNRGVIVDTR